MTDQNTELLENWAAFIKWFRSNGGIISSKLTVKVRAPDPGHVPCPEGRAEAPLLLAASNKVWRGNKTTLRLRQTTMSIPVTDPLPLTNAAVRYRVS